MKKLILAFVALAFAFAISSCCDQSKCPDHLRNREKGCMQKDCNEEKCNRCPDAEKSCGSGKSCSERPRRW